MAEVKSNEAALKDTLTRGKFDIFPDGPTTSVTITDYLTSAYVAKIKTATKMQFDACEAITRGRSVVLAGEGGAGKDFTIDMAISRTAENLCINCNCLGCLRMDPLRSDRSTWTFKCLRVQDREHVVSKILRHRLFVDYYHGVEWTISRVTLDWLHQKYGLNITVIISGDMRFNRDEVKLLRADGIAVVAQTVETEFSLADYASFDKIYCLKRGPFYASGEPKLSVRHKAPDATAVDALAKCHWYLTHGAPSVLLFFTKVPYNKKSRAFEEKFTAGKEGQTEFLVDKLRHYSYATIRSIRDGDNDTGFEFVAGDWRFVLDGEYMNEEQLLAKLKTYIQHATGAS